MMQIPVQISFRHLEYSPYIATAARKRVARLEKFYPRITSVRVLIEPSEKRHHQGNLYHVRIDITVPGGEIVIGRDPSEDHAHEDLYVAMRDAFDAATRKLEDHVLTHYRPKKRQHEAPPHAKVTRLFPNEDCGFLETEDGREIYFHKNAVINGAFDKLEIGDEVRFAETQGEKGPQASTVDRVGKNGKHVKIA